MACEQCERLTAEINRAIDASEHGKCKDAIQDMLAIDSWRTYSIGDTFKEAADNCIGRTEILQPCST